MTRMQRVCATLGFALLCGCGGGGGSSAVPGAPASGGSATWLGALRQQPSAVTLSLAKPQMSYLYVDSGATNGSYPSAAAFGAQFEAANPWLATGGACAKIAKVTGAVMELTDAYGVQAPSYVLFFTPLAVGTCTQQIALGADGTGSFTVTVTP